MAGVSLMVMVMALPASALTTIYTDGQVVTTPMVLPADATLDIMSGRAIQRGVISGAYEVTKNGAGWLDLEGVNTYTGGTVIANGSLGVGTGGLGTGNVEIMNGARLGANGVFSNTMGIGGQAALSTAYGLTWNGVISGTGTLVYSGTGNPGVLAGNNTYTGGTIIKSGVVQLEHDNALGTGAVTVQGGMFSYGAGVSINNAMTYTQNGTARVNSGTAYQRGAIKLTGFPSFSKVGDGELVLDAVNTMPGQLQVAEGTLTAARVGALTDGVDVSIGSLATLKFQAKHTISALRGYGKLALDGVQVDVAQDANTEFARTMIGAAGSYMRKLTAGRLTLSGDSAASYGGSFLAGGGVLDIAGDYRAADVLVSSGTLTGSGRIGEVSVSVGTLAGKAGQTLTMDSLGMMSGSAINVALGLPNADALFHVTGDVRLDGYINIEDAGGFGPGVYRIMDYDGAMDYLGMYFNIIPNGIDEADLELQLAVANQVNIVNSSAIGGPVLFWDGGDSALWNNGAIDGGAGTWRVGVKSFTTANGDINNTMAPMPGFAVFQGPGGEVEVDTTDGYMEVSGIQFASDGYRLTGDGRDLSGPEAIIRVGDGTAAGADYEAVLDIWLDRDSRLVKTDLGTLVLAEDMDHDGGTEVRQGTLEVNATIGDVVVGEDGRLRGVGVVGNTEVRGVITAGGKYQDETSRVPAGGSTIGTLIVDGDLTFSSGGIFEVEVDAAGNADLIEVRGTAYLDGQVKTLASGGDYAASTEYSILHADGGLDGRFENVKSNLAFLDAALAYDANDVVLTMTRNGKTFANIGTTDNQRAVGAAVESLGVGNVVYDRALSFSAEDALAGFDQLSGEVQASLKGVLLTNDQALGNTLGARVGSVLGGETAEGERAVGASGGARRAVLSASSTAMAMRRPPTILPAICLSGRTPSSTRTG